MIVTVNSESTQYILVYLALIVKFCLCETVHMI